MESPSRLREKAEHCRRLARLIANEQVEAELLKLAADLEAKADEALAAAADDLTASSSC